MTKKILFAVMVVALAAFVATPSASAACIPAKTAVTFGGVTAYWLPATAVGTVAVQSWQLGNPGAWQGTSCPDSALFPDGPGFSLNYNLGGCGAGCPGALSTLAVLAQNKTASGTEFLLDTVVETPANPNGNFHYGAQGNHTMISIPRPKIQSSSRSGNNVNLSVQIDSIAAGSFGPSAASAVTGFNILSASLPVAQSTDAGRDALAYTFRATAASPGGAAATKAVTLDCSDTTRDQWIVVQLQFETGLVLGNTVGASARVKCNPALADPTPRNIPKKVGAPKIEHP